VDRGLELGRRAYERAAWGDAYAHLSAADRETPLDLDDLERLAVAAYLTGRAEESAGLWARAHLRCAQVGDPARAARCAFWLAFGLLNAGELARGGGWIDRAQRLLAGDQGEQQDCVEQGYLRYSVALRTLFEGDDATARDAFVQAAGIGARFRDPQLVALARAGEGRCLIYLGQLAQGMALLDEAMVAITAREVSPTAVGDLYCTVIDGCQEVFDVRRAREWTAALSHWCDAQPELVLYRGQCLIHRAEIMLLRGAWGDALDEVRRAIERLAQPASQRAVGAAYYLLGELHRLHGEVTAAEEVYRQANQWGQQPQPGLALLRLAQGRVDAASAAIRRVLDEAEHAFARAPLLAPYVEIVLAAGDVGAGRAAAEELAGVASSWEAPLLQAQAAQARGAVLLAEGDARGAVAALRRAWAGWRELEAPYDAARARVLLGLACRALGDEDGAAMELDAARSVFERLGAGPDLARVEQLARTAPRPTPGGLTARELEVLALVAGGRTNRAIAAELVISERTVATHVSSILTKLGLPSRSAATAYAYRHHLV
jgi:DNA-binding NarL/FixJ family response regulator